ncbi:MAG: putative bifunctional diguanylate cyclase/phosphodiesterase [Mycobacteriales bacterium]
MTAVLVASGAGSPRTTLRDPGGTRLLMLAASTITGLVGGLVAQVHPSFTALAVLPLLVLRLVLEGHFLAQRDRLRLMGLYDATLRVTRTSDPRGVWEAIESSTRELLRSGDAVLTDDVSDAQLSAPLNTPGLPAFLAVRGRERGEPFDDADRSLLSALAAVGSAALSNAATYEQARFERERLHAITDSLGEGVCAFDILGRVTFANPAAEALLGVTEAELRDPRPGATLFACLDSLIRAARPALAGGTYREEDGLVQRVDGAAVPVAYTCSPILTDGRPVGAVVTLRDITERKAFEEQLTHQAFHDALTGLPNRRIFLDRLDHAMARSTRRGESHAVLFADVDRFKIANDNLGHQAGDQLLTAISARMASLLRPGDTLARFGGDEFTILVENIEGPADAERLAERVHAEMRAPVVLDNGREVLATLSIGIALTAGRAGADDVLHDADVAMYQAKRQGPGRCMVFDATAMAARSAERLDLEAGLRRALERGEIEVFYQPIVATDTLRVTGAEALVRWVHPERGLLGPAHFIHLAEETGLVLPLGRHVLEVACAQARQWSDRFSVPFGMSINLSARQFQDPGLVDDIRDSLEAAGLDPGQLCLEITESVAVADLDRTLAILSELKALGVRLAIDDFGTGYSSLKYLKRFPLDIIKIDQAFVADLATDPTDAAIVSAVMSLARAVGMTTIAEGVETAEQLDRLRELGCPLVQGFYLSRPVPSEELTRRLDRGTLREPTARRHLALARG